MANQDRTGARAGAGRRGQARGAAAGRAQAGRRGTAARAGTAGRARASRDGTAAARAGTGSAQAEAAAEGSGRTLTVTVPERAMDVAMLPVAAGRRVLGARSGLPVYVGLGVLAAADVLELPVAAAVGVGYAALRRWGPLRPARRGPDGEKAQSS